MFKQIVRAAGIDLSRMDRRSQWLDQVFWNLPPNSSHTEHNMTIAIQSR